MTSAASVSQSFPQFFNAWWLDEQGQGTFAVELLDIASAYNVHIEDDVITFVEDTFDFTFQRPIKLIRIDFFIFQEVTSCNVLPELIRSHEIVFHAVLLTSPWRTAGCRYGEA